MHKRREKPFYIRINFNCCIAQGCAKVAPENNILEFIKKDDCHGNHKFKRNRKRVDGIPKAILG